MKTTIIIGLCLVSFLPLADGQGTAFSYQGRLSDGSQPASGSYDFSFSLFDAATNGSVVAGPVTNSLVSVSNGFFNVELDFGAGAFNGAARWLGISVHTNGAASWTALAPLQAVTPTPYAILSVGASNLLGTLPATQLAGTIGSANFPASPSFSGTVSATGFTGVGSGLSQLNASQLGSGTVPDARLGGNVARTTQVWLLGGNAATGPSNFFGTLDNQPLDLRVNGERALRLEPVADTAFASNAVNVIGGSIANSAGPGVLGATIGGGGAPYYFGPGTGNRVFDSFTTIGGGVNNQILSNAWESTIAGGNDNTVAPGAYRSTIAGGWNNTAGTNASHSFIGGGSQNTAADPFSTIMGGTGNRVSSLGQGSTIGGGTNNQISYTSFISDFGGSCSTIAGGRYNRTYGDSCTIGGGFSNVVANLYSSEGPVVAGGAGNEADNIGAIGGGVGNYATGGTVPGGWHNSAVGLYSFAAGQFAGANNDGSFVWADGQAGSYSSDRNNQVKFRAGGGIVMDVSGSSGLNPPALFIHSTSGNGVGEYIVETSSDAAFVVNNTGAGDIFKGFNGGGNPVFEVVNDGTVYSKGFALSSDRNLKEHFQPLDSQSVLDKVAALPLTEWNYKDGPATTRHMGPMAQDFHAAFGLNGEDDKHIAVVDEAGVALAAVQGLNQKLEAELKAKETEIQRLQERLERLELRLEDSPPPGTK